MRPDAPFPDGVDSPPRMYLDPSYVSRVQEAGATVGLDYTHLCRRVPNTLLSHTLISWAGEASPAKQSAVAEIVFRQYHTEGRYPDEANLVSAGVEAGLDADAARAALTSTERQEATVAEVQRNARVGGVPHMVINGQGGNGPNGQASIHGAQPASVILQALTQAAAA